MNKFNDKGIHSVRIFLIIVFLVSVLVSPAFAVNELPISSGSLSLAQLYRQYIDTDNEVVAKRYAVKSSEAKHWQANAQYFPRLSLVSSLNANQTFEPNAFQNLPIFTGNTATTNPIYYRFNTGLSIRYTIWDGNNRGAMTLKASSYEEIAKLELQRMKEERLYQVAQNYFNLAGYNLKLQYASAAQQEIVANLDKLKLKLNAGMIKQLDYDYASMKNSEIELLLERYGNDKSLVLQQLTNFTKQPDMVFDTTEAETILAKNTNEVMSALPPDDVQNTVDYKIAKLNALVTESDLIAAQSKLSPTINLSANYLWEQNKQDKNFDMLFNDLYKVWTASLNIEYPIFDGNSNGSEADAASYDKLSKKSAEISATTNTQYQMAKIQNDYAIAYKNYVLSQKNYELSLKQVEITKVRFINGLDTQSNYINMLVSANRSYADMVDARINVEVVKMQYYKLLALLEKNIIKG